MPPGPSSSATAHESTVVRVVPSLNDIERRILDFMVSYLRTNTYQPSIREIGQRFGIKSTKTVSEHLQALANKGYVERDPSRSRGIRILGIDLNAQTVSLPCFRDLRDATSGSREGAAEVRISLDRQLVSRGGGFVVRAPRDRLAAAGISEGDFLVIQPVRADELADGEIIVARGGGVTDFFQLKKRGSRFFFYPIGGDPSVPDGPEGAHPVIIGRVAALYRRMSALPFTAPITAH
ncbi:MAG: hypothetical protein F4Z92_05830 [Gemmatimonadetes bacterium]|nr:hypothetical protein [Gemmatimonadota bacterium]